MSEEKKLFRIFGPELIRINSLIKTAPSAVSKNCRERGFFLCGVTATRFWKRDISNAERAFPGFFGEFFGCSNPFNINTCSHALMQYTSRLTSRMRAAWHVYSNIDDREYQVWCIRLATVCLVMSLDVTSTERGYTNKCKLERCRSKMARSNEATRSNTNMNKLWHASASEPYTH